LAHAFLRHLDVARQRRPAERPQIQRDDDMPLGQRSRDLARRIELNAVPLPVIDGQRDHGEAGLARQRGADHRIEPTREKNHSTFHCGRHLGAHAGQKKGRPSVKRGGPSYRAYMPDWEESVPNPARNTLTLKWLNAALMT